MAYFAQIDQDGTVLQVISIGNEHAPDPAPDQSEPLGRAFIASLGFSGEWRQTSYHGSIRKRFAPVGGKYLADADVFIWPQPFQSWTLDADYEWQPPTPYPADGGMYEWDEGTLSWVKVTA